MKLPPLDLKDEAQYEAFSEKKEIEFKKCPHNKVSITDNALTCLLCHTSWYGPSDQLIQLENLLSK